ncbi:MAG: T9SS type A sorting domain-containing protein, partial [Flavobacteriales bacterium]
GLNNTSTSFLPTELNVANGNITFGANAQAAQYTGTRNGQATFAGYKALVNNTANWATVTTGTLAVNTTAFVLSAGGPTQIVVTSVNGGSSPTANAPFTISIETQDGTNTGASVSQNTDVLISIFDGTGSLIGSTTGTVLMGASTLTLTGVIYNTAETDVILTISRTAGDVLTSSNTPAFDVLQPASQIAFNNLSTFSYTNTIVQFFNVEARRPDNSVDNTYNGSATISLISGTGAITGTLTKPIVNGVALFNDIAFTTAGIKQIDAAAGVFTTITSPSITVSTPALAENHLPQYMQGTTVASNSTRVPYAARLTLSGLQASTTYRYTNQMVEAADGAAVNGAGNPIYANGAGFVRTTSASLSTLGGYGEFTTDAAGQFSGWFITEPTGNARFTPGNNVYMRVAINNGAGGTFVALRLTTTNTISVINFGATATDGTGLRGSSSAVAKNFVLLYDNTAGTGRPIAGSFVESDGSANTAGNSYVAFYGTSVEAQAGAYGTIIPNNLPNGIRRIEQRSLAQALIVSCAATDADGVWPSGANTVNPNTGTTAKVVTSLDAEFNPACVTLVPGNNDHFLSAALAPMSGLAYPAGNCYSGTLVGATVSSQGTAANVLVAGGQDRWYAFVAPSPACRVVTTTASMNIVLELHASDGSLIDTENDVAGIGGEIMATNGLTEGYTYFVAVRSYDGVLGAYSVCVQALMDSHCNDGSGTYDRCANFKPNWTGANSYTFNFTPTAPTPGIPTSATAVGQISLSNATLALIHGGTYDATIDVTYNLTDGAGNPETLVVAGNQVCSIIIANHASVEVKAEQRCGYPATLLKGSVMQGKPYVCGVTNYTVRFTKVTDCTGATTDGLPFTVNTTGASASLNLSFTLPQPLVAMSHYLVEWQPNFGYGAGLYGTPRVIFVGGSVMETELTGNDMQTKSASVQAAIYPNPNSGEMMNLNYTGEYIGILQVRISDAMGRKVCTRQYAVDGNLSTALVFENQLAPGVYLVEFVAGAEVTTERLLIQR